MNNNDDDLINFSNTTTSTTPSSSFFQALPPPPPPIDKRTRRAVGNGGGGGSATTGIANKRMAFEQQQQHNQPLPLSQSNKKSKTSILDSSDFALIAIGSLRKYKKANKMRLKTSSTKFELAEAVCNHFNSSMPILTQASLKQLEDLVRDSFLPSITKHYDNQIAINYAKGQARRKKSLDDSAVNSGDNTYAATTGTTTQ